MRATAGCSNCIQFSNGMIVPLDSSFLKKQLSQPFFITASGPSLS
ncbi:hypothetical protein SynMVIR181_01612 [Synechococcus sp. MVIR-18-1]|nr:hypothetical protein SynMVIR181_01612 [Synechococcus sp. MVIR-18-1]